MPTLSIIIVNYKVEEELLECLKSIYASNPKVSFEIIVVDNSEKDKLNSYLKNKFPKVIYTKPENNLGYGGGNNLGAEIAKGEYLFILNPDTKIIEGSIENLVSFIKNNKKVGAVSPQLLHKDGSLFKLQGARELSPKRAIFSLSFLARLLPNNKIYRQYYILPWDNKKNREVDIVPGTAFVLKKSLFEKIGGFDEKFFLFFEEFDLCKRLRQLGYRNYILPDLKIYHKWEASTKKNKSTKKYFLQSRFYYFKKHYGLLKALFTEAFLRVNKESIFVLCISFLALFLRVYKLPDFMAFIGDTAWFFVSAKDIFVTHQIPLVGITTSHTWLHQGPFWTYILAFVLPIFKFNPIGAGYFTAFLDVATLVVIYVFCREYFGKKVALISSIFYATSFLIIIFARIPYHTNPIPLLTILLIFTVLKWINGNMKYFPAIFFLLAILYNFEISIFPLVFVVMFICVYGIFKKTKWMISVLNVKSISLALLAFLLPMIPMILYDVSHKFPQTIQVFLWIGYKVAVVFGYPELHPDVSGEIWTKFFGFVLKSIGSFYFIKSYLLSLFVFFASIFFAFYNVFQNKKESKSLAVVLLFFFIPALAFVFAKTSSQAYLPMLIVQCVILFSYLLGSIKGKSFYFSIVLLVVFSFSNINSVYGFYTGSLSVRFDERLSAAKEIVRVSDDLPYNIVVRGPIGEFPSAAAPYEYLAWWLGSPPSSENEKTKLYVTETSDKIIVEKKFIK